MFNPCKQEFFGADGRAEERKREKIVICQCAAIQKFLPPSTRAVTSSSLSLSKFTYTCLTRGGRPTILEKYQPAANYNLLVIYGFNLRTDSSQSNGCFEIIFFHRGFVE